MISMISNDGEINYGIREYLADSVSDMEAISLRGVSPGSKTLVIEDMTVYILSNNKIWVPYGVGLDDNDINSMYINKNVPQSK